jgi:hypothetical protein
MNESPDLAAFLEGVRRILDETPEEIAARAAADAERRAKLREGQRRRRERERREKEGAAAEGPRSPSMQMPL